MVRGSDSGRGKIDLAGIGFGIGDELGNRFGGKRRIYHHDVGRADDAGNGCDVSDKVEIEFLVERCVDCGGSACRQEKRIAVRRCFHDRLGADIGAGAGAVFDDESRAQPLR
jgi:hypothetical protein